MGQKKVRSKRSWTRYAVQFTKLYSIYNLRPNVFEKIRLLYRKGREESNGVPALRPRQLNYIRQDILAYYFIFEYKLSENDLRVAKNPAKRRNMRRTQCVSEDAAKQWPGRPDVFLKFPAVDVGGVSDDEFAEYLCSEIYRGMLGSVDDEQDIATATSSEVGEEESLSETTERNRLSLNSLEVNWSSLRLLKDLYETFEYQPSHLDTMQKYSIDEQKAKESKAAIESLRENAIEGITAADFEKTFESEDVMNMPLQVDKIGSIEMAVHLYRQITDR